MILAHTYEAGNTATAHLTHRTPFKANPTIVIQGATLILELLDENLYNR